MTANCTIIPAKIRQLYQERSAIFIFFADRFVLSINIAIPQEGLNIKFLNFRSEIETLYATPVKNSNTISKKECYT
ncbi:hypothetical protein [Okeania sp. SIO3I5]|uniref:hypothetical protein n=1 Tax=Okeania sp. SIO3I5 TaxID=2607805 RepID=UPI0025F0CD0F|nr:hypothetical protein [Okeania sp. SIO3I5]